MDDMTTRFENQSLTEIIRSVENAFNQNPGPIAGVHVIYQFDITGEEEGTFQLHLQDGKAKVIHDTSSVADCTLKMSAESFKKFLSGSLSGTMAFMTGKLKIDGDLGKALKLEAILKQYDLAK